NKYGSSTSETAPNAVTTFYVYDDQNRPFLVKDDQGNIIKRYTYRYRDEDEYYSALLSYSGTTNVGEDIAFTLRHHDYAPDEGQYECDFGDGVQLTTDTSFVSHAFASLGFYKVSVQAVYQGSAIVITDAKPVHIDTPGGLSATVTGPAQGEICLSTPNG